MTLPPEILEQISEACTNHPRQKDISDPEMKGLYRCGFIDGSKLGYSLRQKQTPPATPTGRKFWIARVTKMFFGPETYRKTTDRLCDSLLEATQQEHDEIIHTREVTDRDQKIAQAVEGLVQTMRTAYDYMKNFDCDKSCDPMVNFHQPECCIANDFNEALSKYEEAKK